MPDPVQDEILASKIAAITVATPSVSVLSLSRQLGVGATTIKRLMASESYHSLMTSMTREQIAPMLAKVKTDIYSLGAEAVRVLKEQLEANNLEAAKTVLKVMALDTPTESQPDTQLTVIVPGANINERVIEVKNAETE